MNYQKKLKDINKRNNKRIFQNYLVFIAAIKHFSGSD